MNEISKNDYIKLKTTDRSDFIYLTPGPFVIDISSTSSPDRMLSQPLE